MIKFKQKEYSSTTAKAIYRAKKAVNSLKGPRGASPYAVKRSAVNSAKKVKTLAYNVADNPGHYLGEKVVRPTIEAPVTGIASKLIPIPGMTATQVTVLAPIEKKFQPKIVRKGLEKVGKVVGNITKHTTNAAKDIMMSNPGIFIPGM